MSVKRLRFENFRNFQSLDLEFRQGFVVFVGPNGAGKTNLLEGIYFGSLLRRFPESKLHQLFKKGEDFFRIVVTLNIEDEKRQEVFFQKKDDKYQSKVKINNQAFPRTKYGGEAPVVSFLPQDLNLLTRSPQKRRRYLNETLSLVSLEYRSALRSYEKALKQRNELLRNAPAGQLTFSELEIWDQKLAEYGSILIKFRKDFMKFVNENVGKILEKLFSNLSVSHFAYYNSGRENKDIFLELLREAYEKEKILGTTIVGPHRDDFEAFLGEDAVVGNLSRGQIRSIVLSLKILEQKYLQKFFDRPPVLVLDDVFSEFDQEHQTFLIEFLKDFEQVFITTTHLEELENFLPKAAQVFRIKSGQVLENV